MLAVAAGSLVVLAALPQAAHAQFVCENDLDNTGGGATAAGSSANNVACGTSADASGRRSRNTATGNRADASGRRSRNTATGNRADASGNDSRNIATGNRADASGNDSRNIATGNNADASGNDSTNIATGNNANASGEESANSATGADAMAFGDFSTNVAVGTEANAAGDNASNTAIGAFSEATGQNSSAFGTGASATHANSAAFGQNATTTRDNQQVFGTETNTYTMTGIASQASRVAQEAGGGPEYLVTTNAGGDLAAHTFTELGVASARDVARNSARVDENTEGVSMAIAMGGTYLPKPGETIRLSGNWGNFEGSNALAFSGALTIGSGTYFTAGVGIGLEESTVGGRAGVSVGW